MLSNDLLRTGAALVRRLAEGEADVRFALSDFLEEHGIPNRAGRLASQDVLARTLAELRSDAKDSRPATVQRGVHHYVIGTSFAYCVYVGPERSVWVGTWPMWAWEGKDAGTYGPYEGEGWDEVVDPDEFNALHPDK